jgi:hypothetical protein
MTHPPKTEPVLVLDWDLSRGNTAGEAGRKIGVTEQTYHRRRTITGGVGPFPRSGPLFYGPYLGWFGRRWALSSFKSHGFLPRGPVPIGKLSMSHL